MKSTNANGKLITVTDLDKAIEQADLFRGFKHEDESFEKFDKQQNKYWSDIYHKLVTLKKQNNEHKIF